MKLTYTQVFGLQQALSSLKGLSGVQFNYSTIRNLKILQSTIEDVQNASKASEEFLKYDQERVELAESFAEKDEKGNAIIIENKYHIQKKHKKTFEEKIEELRAKYSDAIAQREKQINELNDMLQNDSIELELATFKLEQLPQELTTEQIAGIYDLIEDETR